MDTPTARTPTIRDAPRAWLRLHEHPFEGEWVGLSWDWAETLPCDPVDLAWARLWIAIRGPRESQLASALLAEIKARVDAQGRNDLLEELGPS